MDVPFCFRGIVPHSGKTRYSSLRTNPLAQSPGQGKIVKEFVWIDRKFSKFGFRANRRKKLRQRLVLFLYSWFTSQDYMQGMWHSKTRRTLTTVLHMSLYVSHFRNMGAPFMWILKKKYDYWWALIRYMYV